MTGITLLLRLRRGLLPARSLNQDSIKALDLGVTLWKFSLGLIGWRLRPVSGRVLSSCFLVRTVLRKFWTLDSEKLWLRADPYSSAWLKLGVCEKPCFTLTGVSSSWR